MLGHLVSNAASHAGTNKPQSSRLDFHWFKRLLGLFRRPLLPLG